MLIASLVSFLHAACTQRDAISRIQLQWSGFGLFVGIGLMLLVFPSASGMVAHPLLAQLMGAGFQLGFTVLGVALAIAILRYRLFDIQLVINRALVYATLTTGVITAYVLVVGYLGWLFRTEGNVVLSLIATGIIAVGFAPARQLVQRGMNRLLYGERDEPYRVLSRLGQQLETAAAPSVVLAQAAETLARSLKLPYVAIVHHEEHGPRLLAVTGTPPADVTQVPLTYAGAAVGALVVASRDPFAPLSRADQRLLTEVARPISVVAHAAALQSRLEQARLRLVAERGEARRRLGSDLHDRIGHHLAAVTRQVERAQHLIGQNQTGARALLNDITQQLCSVAQEVRGLAHELFPPELALLGLVKAIRERALAYADLPVQVVAPESLVFPAIRAGARGYLLKQTEQDELLRAIRTVAQGGAIFSPGIVQRVLGYLRAPPLVAAGAAFDELAPREREILKGIAHGQTNSEIAAQLNLSPKTVSKYISNILLKVHATDRAKLMLMALEAGMGQQEPGS